MKGKTFRVLLLGLVFSGGYVARDWRSALAVGEAWTPDLRGDVNSDGELNISDVVFLLNFMFSGGEQPAAVSGGRGGLLQTTQTLCYSGTRGQVQTPCPGPGQDDHGQDPQFTKGFLHDYEVMRPDPEDDKTWYTIDYATGLMWQYKSDNVIANWRDALKHIEGIEFAGFDDWRMPNVNELHSIVDISTWNPAIDRDVFFLFPLGYWSSSTCIQDASRAWIVRFQNGVVTCLDKGGQGQDAFKLRTLAVRDLE